MQLSWWAGTEQRLGYDEGTAVLSTTYAYLSWCSWLAETMVMQCEAGRIRRGILLVQLCMRVCSGVCFLVEGALACLVVTMYSS